LFRRSIQHPEHGVLLVQDGSNGRCGVHGEGLELAQVKKSHDVVELGRREDDTCDRRIARFPSRM
jgi:hypothetical protein